MGIRSDVGNRHSLYQRKAEKSGVVYGAKLYESSLLPYEKDLIRLSGCSEKEYRRFVYQAIKRSKIKPAAYDLVPQIKAELTTTVAGVTKLTALGQIVVGVTLTVASYLLTPKPKGPRDAATQITLDSLTGSSRFAPSSGFDSAAELADYATPIPIIFGRYLELDSEGQGGILISPPIVWSRMFSYGTQQGVKLMFAVGEQGYAEEGTIDGIYHPDVKGIFLGSGSLDPIYDRSYAFYWKRNTTNADFSRIRVQNLKYGTNGTPDSGDPDVDIALERNDAFLCPVQGPGRDEGFCSARSLTNNASFGCYAPIPNGTIYKLPWQVVANPKDQGGRAPWHISRTKFREIKDLW